LHGSFDTTTNRYLLTVSGKINKLNFSSSSDSNGIFPWNLPKPDTIGATKIVLVNLLMMDCLGASTDWRGA